MQSSLAWLFVSLVMLGMARAIPTELGFFLGIGAAVFFPLPVMVSSMNAKRSLSLAVVGLLSMFVELSLTTSFKGGSLSPLFLAGQMCLANGLSVGHYVLSTWLVQVGFLGALCAFYSFKGQAMLVHPVLLVLVSAVALILSAIPGRGRSQGRLQEV